MSAFAEQLDDFIWYLSAEKRLADNTALAYRQDLTAWAELLPSLAAGQRKPPAKEELFAALETSRGLEWSRATEARRRASLRHYAKYRALSLAEWESVLEALPASRGEAKFPKALELEEIESLLDFAPGLELEDYRDKALLEIMYASGLRVSELSALRWADVHAEDGWVRVIGKGDAERLVPTSERALRWLREYRERARPLWHESAGPSHREVVFLSRRRAPLSRMGIWKIVQRHGQRAGIEGMHPHILRHSFATHLIQGGADVRVVQILLGHRSLSATERYLKISDRELFKLFTEFHPLS
ncbi:MAG TPA: tyrosine-type recombinase/integrase [Bdellovibrionota bacterium]|jgi:integrase/recombinase XerD|nr:tyrosine-type recombinase/integrase [Bdellovibrionota bacterium]